MATRANDKRLQELKDKGCQIYSISRLNTLHQCNYQAYLNYVLGEKQKPNIWACAGGIIHDRLEDCIHHRGTKEDLRKAIDDELENFQLLDIDFPLDKNGNPTVRNNWIKNMTRFAEEFEIPQGNFETEQLVILPIHENAVMQGYIDVIEHNDDGSVNIWDWKTSSQFTGSHLIEAGRQLVFYAMALENEGLRVNKVQWVMLKYYEMTWIQKNGKPKVKVGEWRNFTEDNLNVFEKKLLELGIDEVDVDMILDKAKKTNTLPDELKDFFTARPYVREYELTDDIKNETMMYIQDTIHNYEELAETHRKWEPCDCKTNSYFCANLCGYGGKTGKCQYWTEYCETFEKKSDDDDLF